MAMENEWLQHHQTELKVTIGSVTFLILTLLLYIYSALLFLLWNTCWTVAATSLIYRHDVTFLNIKTFIYRLLLTYQQIPTSGVAQNQTNDELDTPKSTVKCFICEDGTCDRHRLLPNAERAQPWRNQRLPQKVDNALTYFMNETLRKFVHNWYSQLTDDAVFIDELLTQVRFMSAVILQRTRQVDLSLFLSEEIIPAIITHITQYVQLNRTVAGQDFTQHDIKVHRTRVHKALLTREQELEYCRQLSHLLLPHLTYKHSTNHKLMRLFLEQLLGGLVMFPLTDKICDSDIINNLIIIFCDSTPALTNPYPPSDPVEILAQLSVPNSQYKTILFQDICQVLDDQLALASLMKFMEEEGAIKYLQFFTTLDNFNKKLHSPNLSDKDLSSLHEELCKMYELFCQPHSADYIPLEQELSDEFYHQSKNGIENIMKLRDGRVSNFHSRTYDYLYQKLDQYYLPLYRQNSRFYQQWYGKRTARLSEAQCKSSTWPSALRNISLRSSFRKKPTSIKKSGSSGSLKDLKSHTGDRDSNDSGSSPGTPDQLSLQDEDIADDSLLENLHNLENWTVELHGISIQPDQHDKVVKKFTLRVYKPVKSIDEPDNTKHNSSNHIVFRSYNDFYTLENKLREFHGDKVSTSLPPKRLFNTKDVEFLDKQKPEFEEFLQSILSVRDFQHSELLHSFLTVEDFSKSNVSDIKIVTERVLKSVPRKLVKERGQNLIKFLRSFRTSTLQRTPRPDFTRTTIEEGETPKQSIIKQHLSNPLYEKSHIRQASNGTAISLDNHLLTTTQNTYSEYTEKCYQPESLSYSITRIVVEVFQLPQRSHWIFTSLLLSLRDVIDPCIRWFIGTKLDKVLQEHRIEALIHLLTDILYKEESAPRTAQQKLDRRTKAIHDLKTFFPELLKRACDDNQSFDKSLEEIFNVLQHPKLNKQLIFSLLDIAILKIFPELSPAKSTTL